MSERTPIDTPPGAEDAVAAEYALGLLDGPERAEAARRSLAEPGFAREVERWRMRLAGMAHDVRPVTPPDTMWSRIAARLADEASDGAVVVSLRRRLAAWRTATAAVAGLAASLAAALLWPRPVPTAAPMLTARLAGSGEGAAIFVAIYDPARRAIVLTPAKVDAAAGRSPELWLIPPGGKPVALGVADYAGPVQMVSTRNAEGLSAGALAVSVEPKGGSPTGQPTGPVIATGQLSRL